MSMFDTITCEYELPLPEEVDQLASPPDWCTIEFQTKSLDSTLDTYSIEEDGQIYRDVVTRELAREAGRVVINETSDGIEKVEHTGEITFYTVHMEDEADYWVAFKALFWKGDLKEIELSEWKKQDNKDRIKILDGVNTRLEKQKEAEKKWWYSLREKYFTFIRIIMFLIRWPIGLIANLTWRIEHWLTRR